MDHHSPSTTGMHGIIVAQTSSAAGAFYWFLEQIAAHGPSWNLVPPILMGLAACLGAYWSGRKMKAEIRQSEERHKAILNRIKLGLEPLGQRS